MVTQVLEFDYVAGQTLTGKLFPINSDTQTGGTVNCTEETNRDGLYHAPFSDLAAGQYVLRVYVGGTFAAAFEYILAAVSATYRPADDTETTAVSSDALAEITAAVRSALLGAGALVDSNADEATSIRTALRLNAYALASLRANPKPNYTVDGDSYAWGDLLDKLTNHQAILRQLLADSEGPHVGISYGV